MKRQTKITITIDLDVAAHLHERSVQIMKAANGQSLEEGE